LSAKDAPATVMEAIHWAIRGGFVVEITVERPENLD
jgi:hypothetical protein